jgi:hypothetical protein
MPNWGSAEKAEVPVGVGIPIGTVVTVVATGRTAVPALPGGRLPAAVLTCRPGPVCWLRVW